MNFLTNKKNHMNYIHNYCEYEVSEFADLVEITDTQHQALPLDAKFLDTPCMFPDIMCLITFKQYIFCVLFLVT